MSCWNSNCAGKNRALARSAGPNLHVCCLSYRLHTSKAKTSQASQSQKFASCVCVSICFWILLNFLNSPIVPFHPMFFFFSFSDPYGSISFKILYIYIYTCATAPKNPPSAFQTPSLELKEMLARCWLLDQANLEKKTTKCSPSACQSPSCPSRNSTKTKGLGTVDAVGTVDWLCQLCQLYLKEKHILRKNSIWLTRKHLLKIMSGLKREVLLSRNKVLEQKDRLWQTCVNRKQKRGLIKEKNNALKTGTCLKRRISI